MGSFQHTLIEIAINHLMSLFHESARFGFFLLDDQGRHIRPFQFFKQGGHRRPVAKDHDMIFDARNFLRQPRLEPFLEEWNQVNGKNQKDDEYADELHQHHVQDHQRVPPVRIRPVTGRRQAFPRPL